ncbi:ABC transporter ATP-binding protein [Rothia sp. AR01]|uniref:ABC-type quaternary amine transporter n=1 Tax=Rothia santali TaxID=2949643 RepID=A0A9X2HC96_9MICC|nr:ABC transporter ATP-binding protein [Rothia santali]MCP3425625.1 ABC transporter ATP-binding protein [Rothia santali]
MIESRESLGITFEKATKVYPGTSAPALDGLDMTIEAGELVCLVGPSGGGKTTALMLINRLIDLSSGDIRIGGTSINDLGPIELRRKIGYAIQQTGLFPHMTVGENIGVVPRILGWDRARIRERAHELLELVGLSPADRWVRRYPGQLSGGQQQRVGIARALAADPPVMLMDEPFGALDPITRTTVQDEFLAIHRAVGKTTVFVTHDIDEAIKMGDKIAVLKPGGLLAQFGTPAELLTAPADDFVESFLGDERGLKRLALFTLADVASSEAPGTTPPWPRLPESTTVRAALSAAMAERAGGVLATRGDDVVGLAPLDALVHPDLPEAVA